MRRRRGRAEPRSRSRASCPRDPRRELSSSPWPVGERVDDPDADGLELWTVTAARSDASMRRRWSDGEPSRSRIADVVLLAVRSRLTVSQHRRRASPRFDDGRCPHRARSTGETRAGRRVNARASASPRTRIVGAEPRAARARGCGQRPWPPSAGSSSSSSSKTSASASSAGAAHLVDRDRPAELACDRRERRVLEPARGDPLRERRGVEVDVERVAVRRHPLRDVDADRGDLPRRPRQPDAGEPVDSLALDAELREREDQRLLEVAAVPLDVLPVPLQVEDRVADELPGPWKVDLPPRSVSTISTSAPSGMCSSPSSVRRPGVTVGGCSSSRIVSGIAPCETAPASDRCSSHASLYGTSPRLIDVRARHASPSVVVPAAMPSKISRQRATGSPSSLGDGAVVRREHLVPAERADDRSSR